MSKLFIGYKQGVGGVVKVMVNNADNPLTVPNNDYGRFLFNSETGDVAHIDDWSYYEFDTTCPVGGVKFYGGGDFDTCTGYVTRSGGSGSIESIYSWPNRIIGRPYPVICEMRPGVPLNTEIEGPRASYIQTAGSSGAFSAGVNMATMTYITDMRDVAPGGTDFPEGPICATVPSDTTRTVYGTPASWSNNENKRALITIMDLPCFTQGIPNSTPGTPGTRNTLISPTQVVIAKGGVNMDGATRDEIIIDSSRVPVKVVRAGEVAVVGGGSSTIISPVELTDRSYMDYMVWRDGEPACVPQAITNDSIGNQRFRMTYEIRSDRVVIRNRGSDDLRIRYMICADDGRTSTGGTQVMRNLPSGHQQIKRPGSSDTNPLSGDILLDTRFAYPTIVSSGYIHRDEFTEPSSGNQYGTKAKTISFPNSGNYYPFLKYFVHRQSGASNGYELITEPWAVIAKGGFFADFSNRACSDSTVAIVTDTSVKFHIAPDNPYRAEDDDGNIVIEYENDDKPIGIHYYVFAIPRNL